MSTGRRLRRQLIRTLATFVALTFALLVSLPPVASSLLTRLLTKEGMQAELRDIDIDWLHGRVTLWDLELATPEGLRLQLPRARLEIVPGSLLTRRLDIPEITLEDTRLRLPLDDQGRLQLPAIAAAQSDHRSSPAVRAWQFGLGNLLISNAKIELAAPAHTLDIHLHQLKLGDIRSWAPNMPGHLELEAEPAQGRLQAEMALWPLASPARIQGTLQTGSLSLAPIARLLPSPAPISGQLDTRLEFAAHFTGASDWEATLNGPLTLTEADLKTETFTLNGNRLALEGQTRLAQKDGALIVEHEGMLEGKDLQANPAPWQARVAQLKLEPLKLQMHKARETPAPLRISVASDALLSGAGLSAGSPAQPVGRLERLSLIGLGLAYPQTKVTLAEGLAEGLLLPGGDGNDTGRVQAGSIRLQKLGLLDESIEVALIEVRKADARIVRKADGSFHLPRAAGLSRSGATGTRSKATDSGASRPALPVRIDKISLQGGVQFEDHSVQPTYRGQYKIEHCEIGPLDGEHPARPVPVELKARLHRYTQLELGGRLPLLTWPPAEAELEWSLADLALPRLNPYLQHYTGYRARTGSLDGHGHPVVRQARISGVTRLDLHALKLEVADAKRAATTDALLGIGLEGALAMVRDRKGDIHLELPMQGDLSDPQFDPGPIVAEALKTALTRAATAYTVYAIQPYGAALLLTQVAGKTILKLRLDPIAFPPGKDTLPTDSAAYLDKLATLLGERPELELSICGVATAGERDRLPEKQRTDQGLEVLAMQRAYHVKDDLVSRGVQASRLHTCSPRIDTAPDATPRVELES